MGGTSQTTSNTNQTSQLMPYAPAASGLQGILSGLDPSVANLGVTPGITNAFGQIEANSAGTNPYAAPAGATALSQLNGGANYNTAGNMVTGGYNGATSALAPYTTGNAMDPSTNPALASQLGAVSQQVQNTVNPVFSAAGRLASPANAQAVATGITQGDTGILQNAATNQINAGGILGNLANSSGGILGGLDTGNANIQTQGINNAATAYNMPNLGAENYLTAALAQSQLPIQNASSLTGILGPLAAQFGTQTGSGTQTGTSTPSTLQDIFGGMTALGNLFGGLGNMKKAYTS